ncbi:MAG: hypothetical protein ACTSVZ_02265, partial [Promethearchaeota archaeon]
MKSKTVFSFMILSFLALGMIMTTPSVVALEGDLAVMENQYQGTIAGNETNQFHFRNQVNFQLRTNVSMDLDLDVDCDQLRDLNLTLDLNTTEDRDLTIIASGDRSELGLMKGNIVQTRNEYTHSYAYAEAYQYKEGVVLDLELDGAGSMQAKLGIATGDTLATWAYYDESNYEFVAVQSTYENGYLYADTDHFSIWTVLTPNFTIPTLQNISVSQNQYQARLTANQSYQFTFQNRFNFTFMGNTTTDIDVEVDVNAVGEREFGLELNSTQSRTMTMTINGSAEMYQLTNGSVVAVQTQDQYRYRFLEGIVIEIEVNDTEPLQAELRLRVQNENTTWAYYDEATEEWVPVQSRYVEGELIAETDHFSLWTILTYDEETTSIPGFS